MDELKMKFKADMVDIYKKAVAIGYRPSRFLEMISTNEDIVNVAHRLIAKETDGFTRLYELHSLNLSVEYYILKDEYHDLFTDEDRKICINRLHEYGYIN